MTDLEALRAEAPPRSAALCRRFARRIDSIWGFIGYGLVWFFVSWGIATIALLLSVWIVGAQEARAAPAFVIAAWTGALVGSWVLFGWWVRRRSGPAKRLFRDGVIVDATVRAVRHLRIRGAPFTHATLTLADGTRERMVGLSIGGHPAELAEGVAIAVLWMPDYGYCATFPFGGRMVPVSLRE